MDYCFAADRTLGKLAKWLRILGFDTIFESDVSSQWFYEHLEQERVLLTRIAENRKRFAARSLVFIEADDVYEQLRQVVDELAISMNDSRPFSRCIRCNTPIVAVNKETVYGLVPDYIWETHDEFNRCRRCEKIFWPGSHTERSMEVIKKLFGCNCA
jgi:uncharacterized protein with PIN domain